MPNFVAGDQHTASVQFTNPVNLPTDYVSELYFGIAKAASKVMNFSLLGNETKIVPFAITVPTISGAYDVYLDVLSNLVLLNHFKATEQVSITQPLPPAGIITDIAWGYGSPPSYYSFYAYPTFPSYATSWRFVIQNTGAGPSTYKVGFQLYTNTFGYCMWSMFGSGAVSPSIPAGQSGILDLTITGANGTFSLPSTMGQISAKYGLTQQQTKQVEQILNKAFQQRELYNEEMDKKRDADTQTIIAEMNDVLTPAQFERWNKDFQAMREKFKNRFKRSDKK